MQSDAKDSSDAKDAHCARKASPGVAHAILDKTCALLVRSSFNRRVKAWAMDAAGVHDAGLDDGACGGRLQALLAGAASYRHRLVGRSWRWAEKRVAQVLPRCEAVLGWSCHLGAPSSGCASGALGY